VKKVRILALVHEHLVPPEDTTGIDVLEAEWKMEYDVIETLREMGHTVRVLGINDDLSGIRPTAEAFKPHIVFNLMEAFAGVTTFDQNVVSYLELLRLPYTGCNPRGLVLARDKALSKKLLAYHRIRVPEFAVVRPGRKPVLPKRLTFPMIVKSLFFEASAGISQASVVENHEQLARRVSFIHEKLGTAAIVEQFVDGRELYIGVVGNERLDVFPVWEMSFDRMPDNRWKIATERVKWSTQYQKKHGIMTDRARVDPLLMEQMQRIAKRSYRALDLSGYARIDFRMDEEGRMFVLEANPNPNLAYGEDFAESAEVAAVSYERLLERIITLGLRWCRYYASLADKIVGEVVEPTGAAGLNYTLHEPFGVVGLIIPWNSPMVASAMKVAPALASGNAVILKPPTLTPFVALRLAELALEAGLPEGTFNVTPGDAEAGDALVANAHVAKVSFTGGGQVART